MTKALFDVATRPVEIIPGGRSGTKAWRVAGPGERDWSVWDFGDEMTVHDGPGLLDKTIARIPAEWYRRLTAEERWVHVEGAASAIHTAKLLEMIGGHGDPTFRQLWRAGQ